MVPRDDCVQEMMITKQPIDGKGASHLSRLMAVGEVGEIGQKDLGRREITNRETGMLLSTKSVIWPDRKCAN